MVWIAKTIFGDENSTLAVSTLLDGEYGEGDVYTGIPCLVNREGVAGILEVSLIEKEFEKLKFSSGALKDVFGGIRFKE